MDFGPIRLGNYFALLRYGTMEGWNIGFIGCEFLVHYAIIPFFRFSNISALLSPQRGNLIGLVHCDDAHVLVAPLLGKIDILRTVRVTDAVNLEKLVRDIH